MTKNIKTYKKLVNKYKKMLIDNETICEMYDDCVDILVPELTKIIKEGIQLYKKQEIDFCGIILDRYINAVVFIYGDAKGKEVNDEKVFKIAYFPQDILIECFVLGEYLKDNLNYNFSKLVEDWFKRSSNPDMFKNLKHSVYGNYYYGIGDYVFNSIDIK